MKFNIGDLVMYINLCSHTEGMRLKRETGIGVITRKCTKYGGGLEDYHRIHGENNNEYYGFSKDLILISKVKKKKNLTDKK